MVYMKKRLATLALGAVTSAALLFGNPFSTFTNMTSMHNMMSGSQCQTSCSLQTPAGVQATGQGLKNEEAEPQPAVPYYVSLITFPSLAAVVAIILKLYRAQWRPPDRLAMIGLLRI